MVVKFGKAGAFLACSAYPKCTNTKDFTKDDKGQLQIVERQPVEQEKIGACPDCGGDLVLKTSRTGSRFIACSNYPKCKHTESFSTGVACPREGCGGTLVEKSSKRGKVFYSCNRYPQCDYATWDWPVAEPCPDCGSPILVRKTSKASGERLACPNKKCKYSRALNDQEE